MFDVLFVCFCVVCLWLFGVLGRVWLCFAWLFVCVRVLVDVFVCLFVRLVVCVYCLFAFLCVCECLLFCVCVCVCVRVGSFVRSGVVWVGWSVCWC